MRSNEDFMLLLVTLLADFPQPKTLLLRFSNP